VPGRRQGRSLGKLRRGRVGGGLHLKMIWSVRSDHLRGTDKLQFFHLKVSVRFLLRFLRLGYLVAQRAGMFAVERFRDGLR